MTQGNHEVFSEAHGMMGKYCNSDSKTAKKKVTEKVDCLVQEKIFPKQAAGPRLSFHHPVAPSARCGHQVKPR